MAAAAPGRSRFGLMHVSRPCVRCSELSLYNRDIIYLIRSRARLQQESSQSPARPPGTLPSSEGTAAFVQTGFDVTCCQGNQASRKAGTQEEGRNWLVEETILLKCLKPEKLFDHFTRLV